MTQKAKRAFMEENINGLENDFFRLTGCPMAICSAKTGLLISVNTAMEKQLGLMKGDLSKIKCEFMYTPLINDSENPNRASMRTVIFHLPEATKEFLCNCTFDSEQEHIFIVSVSEKLKKVDPPKPLPHDVLPPTSSDMDISETPLRILVVDDSSLQQKMMAVMLRKLGFQADIAENGEEAVKALDKENYDVIFMDICMPVMNGWQATREIKRKRGENTPFIVAATSNTEPDDKKRCLEAGMDSFIPKPIQLDEVRVILQAAKKIKEPELSPESEQRATKKPYFG